MSNYLTGFFYRVMLFSKEMSDCSFCFLLYNCFENFDKKALTVQNVNIYLFLIVS